MYGEVGRQVTKSKNTVTIDTVGQSFVGWTCSSDRKNNISVIILQRGSAFIMIYLTLTFVTYK